MNRGILLSLLGMGAAIAIVAGASTFSLWQDVASPPEHAFSAGLVDIQVAGEGVAGALTFADGTDCNTSAMAPGSTCVATATITRTTPHADQLAVNLTADDISDTVYSGSCLDWSVTIGSFVDATANAGAVDGDPDSGSFMPFGVEDSATVIITVALDSDADQATCSGDDFTAKVEITAIKNLDPYATAP